GVTATSNGSVPTAMSVPTLVRVATSMVDTVLSSAFATKAVLPSGVIAMPLGFVPTAILDGFKVSVATSIVATAFKLTLARVTNAVLPSGVIATSLANEPMDGNRMSFLASVRASIVDTRSSAPAGTNAVV